MASPRTNSNLQKFYDEAYKAGEAEVFTFFENGEHIGEDYKTALSAFDFEGKTVLDVGCGTGELVRGIAAKGATRVIGLDYSEPAIHDAIKIPHPNTVEFITADITSWTPPVRFDIIVSLGTLEHLDQPVEFLNRLVNQFMAEDGHILVACPHFLNPRGYVWMALATLLQVPMSLSDLHFIHPWHMNEWAQELSLDVEMVTTVDRQWAYGPRLIKDFDKRLRNALRDANLPTENVDEYMSYLSKLVHHLESSKDSSGFDGATAFYRFHRK